MAKKKPATRRTARTASHVRTTKETSVAVTVVLDGNGATRVSTTIPFFDHMLELVGNHALFDLTVKASGDTDADDHHLVEDVGITLGKALHEALGDKHGLARYGNASIPMDEARATAVVDLSGRGYLRYDVGLGAKKIKRFDLQLLEEFLRALVLNAKVTVHVALETGRNTHHCVEAVFKALGRALGEATRFDPRRAGVPSSKGVL